MSLVSAITVQKHWWTLRYAARSRADLCPLDAQCSGRSQEKAALEKALKRASGTWGGFQASRPFHYPSAD
jgi:hypothetical protein